jgi:hypothetical protein
MFDVDVKKWRHFVFGFCFFFHEIQNVPTSNFSKDQNLIGFSFSSLFFGVIASNVGRWASDGTLITF